MARTVPSDPASENKRGIYYCCKHQPIILSSACGDRVQTCCRLARCIDSPSSQQNGPRACMFRTRLPALGPISPLTSQCTSWAIRCPARQRNTVVMQAREEQRAAAFVYCACWVRPASVVQAHHRAAGCLHIFFVVIMGKKMKPPPKMLLFAKPTQTGVSRTSHARTHLDETTDGYL